MFRASSAQLQEDTVVYMKHMVLSLSMRVPVGTRNSHREYTTVSSWSWALEARNM